MRLHLSLDNRRVLSNFFSLSILKGLSYIFPIITVPYLVRVLGPENYGLYSFISALFTYFQIFTDYGFNLSATKIISVNRGDKKRISETFSSILVIKFYLLIISFIILSIILVCFVKFSDNALLYYLSFFGLIGSTFFPIWFFQGVENMKYITNFNLISRTVFTLLVFVFVKDKFDLDVLILLNSLCSFAIGFISLWIVVSRFKVKFEFPKVEILKVQIIEGWYIFISTFAVNMYISSNILILGIFTNNTIVGYYSLVEKIISAMRGIIGALFQAIYPHVCKLSEKPKAQMIKFLKRIGVLVSLFLIPFTIILFYYAEEIVFLLSSQRIEQSILIEKILCFVPLIVAINVPAYQILLVYNFKRSYTFILLSGSVLNIILNIVLVNIMQGVGTAVSVLITELYITVGLYVSIEIKHKEYSLVRGLEEENV